MGAAPTTAPVQGHAALTGDVCSDRGPRDFTLGQASMNCHVSPGEEWVFLGHKKQARGRVTERILQLDLEGMCWLFLNV